MANYNDIANQQMPGLAELVARIRAKQAANAARNPGERPDDRMGRQGQVAIEGEAPIQAQPVKPGAQGRVGVEIGPVSGAPQQPMQLPGVRVPVDASRMQGGQPPAPSASTQPDPRNAMLKQLMAQGMSFEDAFRKVQASG